ncbi:MAG: SCE46.09c [Rhodospirillaceae bacterium]|nr:MAG: SCE46.09c [Rhodospirillaceae bacterium]
MEFHGSIEEIKRYYGEILHSSRDLQTSACCSDAPVSPEVALCLRNVHPEVKERFYGCGSPLPPAVEGLSVLDLGCGLGRDCYVLSQLVGPRGRVIGLDMTEAQLDVARRHLDGHAGRFGFANVDFRLGYMEDLAAVGIESESIDLVISNCVINLSPCKPKVFAEIFRVLKTGGEVCFSDIFADRRVPATFAADPVLRGECLGGALYTEDFCRMMAHAGCADVRTLSRRPLALHTPEITHKIGPVRFFSTTVRAFKLALEDACEDYGHVACYRGTLPGYPHGFDLDDHHSFERGRPVLVCGNTADMLTKTRYAPHFDVTGDTSVHFGPFPCSPHRPSPALSCC